MNRNFAPADCPIDPRLAAEALATADLPLCRVLLRNEARFPWLVLVPRIVDLSETFELPPADRQILWAEVDAAASVLKDVTGSDKINIAAFGNIVRQLHLHVVARRKEDPAWPGAAVGWAPALPYSSETVPAFWPAFLRRLNLVARA